MRNLEGKMICNAFMEYDDDDPCNHRVPHERVMFCAMACKNSGTCVPIQVYCRVNGEPVYFIKTQDDETHMIPKDPFSEMPDFNMDEKIYICPSHASCPYDDCDHKQFHNRKDECESECYCLGVLPNLCGVACREANSDEILQLFRDHEGENQHIDDLLKQDDKAYLDFMTELIKPKPETPKPVHERVQRFLNLEL